MTVGFSTNIYAMARTMNIGSGMGSKRHIHFGSENDTGQPVLIKAITNKILGTSQTRDKMANSRVLGLPTDWSFIQPPPEMNRLGFIAR
jgi:hypothetical protein